MHKQRLPLLLFSHRVELDTCVDALRSRCAYPFRTERVGIGPRNARMRAAHLLDNNEDISAVLALGSAGWLRKGPLPTPAVWAREVKTPTGFTLRPTLSPPPQVMERLNFYSARLVTVSRPVTNTDRALDLADRAGAEMVDMESRAILEECIDRHIQCAVIRVVTDRANEKAMANYRQRVGGAMELLAQHVVPLLNWLHLREAQRLEKLAQ